MQTIPLSAAPRDAKAKANVLRKSGNVPCILYGNNVENTMLMCEEVSLKKAYIKAGENTLVELDTGSKKVPVLFHHVDLDPVSDRFIHADFYAVDMTKELEAPVPVRTTGESLAVKDLGGILVTPVETVTVKCLPSDLPKELVLDISKLAELHSVVTIADLEIPKGVTVLDDAETVLATVQEMRKEEEVAPAPAAAAEGAPAAEGAAPAADAAKAESDKE